MAFLAERAKEPGLGHSTISNAGYRQQQRTRLNSDGYTAQHTARLYGCVNGL